jgi:iron complex outermembrane recepter protein
VAASKGEFMSKSILRLRAALAGSAAILSISAAMADTSTSLSVQPQPMSDALRVVARKTGENILFTPESVAGLQAPAISGQMNALQAVNMLTRGTSLEVVSDGSGSLIVRNAAPQQLPMQFAQADTTAAAPSAPQGNDQQPEKVETMIVSSSRITAAGFDAPTPTTVLSADDIAKQGQSNVFSAVTELPSLMGSTGTTTGNHGTSGGTNGLSAFGIHGVGTNRALTLIDGQRVVPANVGGTVDISQFPQLLIKRIDVVTGGASASWGSDAVSGVVNFILDNRFSGFKANMLTGITTYGDDENATLQAAVGEDFLGGKAHLVTSLEYSYEAGIGAGTYGTGCVQGGGRCWYSSPGILQYGLGGVNDPVGQARINAGLPQYVYGLNTEDYQETKWGIITRGPLQGIAFNANGTPYNFNYGPGQTPNHDGSGTVTNCASPLCIGGDTSNDFGAGSTLQGSNTRGNVYSRLTYDITPTTDIWVGFLGSQVRTRNISFIGAYRPDYFSLKCDNAYLDPSVATLCVNDLGANGSFMLGTINANLPGPVTIVNQRDLWRYTAGADGAFSLLGKDWTWNAYVEHANNNSSIKVRNANLIPYWKYAVDAIKDPTTGIIECRDPNARAIGCQPFDLFGDVQPSAGALQWLHGGTLDNRTGPYQLTHERQEMASWVINGSPIDLWAGPVNVATGMEYREEAFNVTGDPDSNGLGAQQPLLSSSGSNWMVGNFHSGGGNYHVTEGFVELVVPLLDSTDWGKANIDMAGRATGYSTSGYVNTWKAGLTWDTPVDGLRLRALQSRDVRAPNLSELFAPPSGINSSIQDNLKTGQPPTAVNVLNQQRGNLALKPEKSINTEVGVVYQPSWFPGFRVSADYWRLDIKGEIGALTNQQEVQLCHDGNQAECNALITATGGDPHVDRIVQVVLEPFNLATQVTDGFDYEASYQFDLQDWDVPGNFVLRALATNVMKFITTSGIPSTIPLESAGANTGNTPHWKVLATQGWSNDKLSFTVSERWISAGVFNMAYIQCASACPTPTTYNPTINNNRMAGALYLDLGGSYQFDEHWQGYFKIDNAANVDPVPSPPLTAAANSDGSNPALYDTVGRMFHIGVRVSD